MNSKHSMVMLFVAFLVGLASSAVAEQDNAAESPRTPTIRTITYNIHGGGPVAATDQGKARVRQMRSQGQYLDRLVLELKLYKPDIITIQEAGSEKLMKQLAERMEMNLAYFSGGWRGKGWPEGISGALLTRFNIIEQENCPLVNFEKRPEDIFSRHFGRVLLKVGDEELAVYSTHMLPSWKNTTHIRLGEISEILAVMDKDILKNRSILVQGDFNHQPDGEEFKAWTKGGMTDTFAKNETNVELTCPSIEPTERIDYILARGPIAERLKRSRILYEGAFRAYEEDETSYALSDHIPVFAEFTGN